MMRSKLFPLSLAGSVFLHLLAVLLLAASGYFVLKQPREEIIYVEAVDLAPAAVVAGPAGSAGSGMMRDGEAGGQSAASSEAAPSSFTVTPRQRPDVAQASAAQAGPEQNNTVRNTAPASTDSSALADTMVPASGTAGGIAAGAGGTEAPASGSGAGGTGAGSGTGSGTGSSTGSGTGSGSSSGGTGSGGGGSGDVDNSAGASGNNSGHYDEAAVEREIEGTVTVRGLLNADGSVSNVSVVASSGNSTIDGMGVRDMYGGSYRPARGKNGKPIASYITKSFTYRLY